MNWKIHLLCLALAAGMSANAAVLNLASGTLNHAIPDGNVNGYQSTLNFNDAYYNNILDVNVKLNISGGYNGDLYVYLTHGSGFSVLLNRVGRSGNSFGYPDTGFNITLDDSAGHDVHSYVTVVHTIGPGGQLLGTWQPDARNTDPATVQLSSTRDAYLSSFNNLNPNGDWTLFIADMSGGDQSTLVSWELDITAVPEPTTVALGVFGGLFALVGGLRFWRQRRAA